MSRRNTTRNGPHPVDVHVGSRVRVRRTLLGMSQEKLGEAMGLTFQQIQKYEKGSNRISASALHDISRILDTPVAWFFEGAPGEGAQVIPLTADNDPLARRETLELARAYWRLSPRLRKAVFDLAKAGAKEDAAASKRMLAG